MPFDLTTYYKFWIDRITKEKQFIKNHKKKNTGDMVQLEKRAYEIINITLSDMKKIHETFNDGDELNLIYPKVYDNIEDDFLDTDSEDEDNLEDFDNLQELEA